jgi:hypothetical protein
MYKKGDVVWYASCGSEQVRVDCPVCFGKMNVTLILGNGEQVQTSCNYCGNGFDGPRGYITEYEYVAAPKQITVVGVNTRDEGDVTKVEYQIGGGYIVYPSDVFDTKEEAVLRCEAKATQNEKDTDETKMNCVKGKKKSISWEVGYHRREIERLKKTMEWHEKKVSTLKEKK